MTEQEYASKKRGLQCKIARQRSATRSASATADKVKAMKQVQLLELALHRLAVDFVMADGA